MLTRSCADYCEGINESSSIDENGDLLGYHLFCDRDSAPPMSVVVKRNDSAGSAEGENNDD
jgi:hypothetical protein